MKQDDAENILKHLAEQEKAEGSLPPVLEFYRDLLVVQKQFRDRIITTVPKIDRDTVQSRMSGELPMLTADDLNLDPSLLRDILSQVTGVFASYPHLFGDSVVVVNDMNDDLSFSATHVKAWYSGRTMPEALSNEFSEDLKSAIIQAVIQPFLWCFAETVHDSFEQEGWRRNHCPVCGGIPDMAYLKGETGERWLLCSRCDTEWLYQRLACPYCGNQEQNSLVFFTDEDDRYRLYICEKCKSYLKAVDLRKAVDDVPMALQRIYTLDMDKQAIERGYHAGQSPR